MKLWAAAARSRLRIDAQGKTLGAALLRMEIETLPGESE